MCVSFELVKISRWSDLEWDESKLEKIVRPGPMWPQDKEQVPPFCLSVTLVPTFCLSVTLALLLCFHLLLFMRLPLRPSRVVCV